MSGAEEPDTTAHGPDGLDARPAGPSADFEQLIDALRLVQERITTAGPPPDVVAGTADTLEKLAATLALYEVDEGRQIVAQPIDLPGRGQALVPVLHLDQWDGDHVAAHVTLGRYYLGAGGAAHGGVLGLVFDELMGRLANTGRARSRTAYLHVNYRAVTPIGPELRVSARVDRIEGRKRFVTGTIYHGDTLTADAEGLFVELRPGQP